MCAPVFYQLRREESEICREDKRSNQRKNVFRASNFSNKLFHWELICKDRWESCMHLANKLIGSIIVIISKRQMNFYLFENFQISFTPKIYLVTRAIFYPHTHSPTKAYNGTDWIDEIEARKRVLASRLLKKDHTNERDVNSATPCAMTKLKIINADNNSAEEHIITSVVSSVISFNRIGSFSEEEKVSRRKKNNSYLVCAGAMMMMMQPNNARVSTTCSEKSTRWVHSERVACDCAADYFGRLLLVKCTTHARTFHEMSTLPSSM